MDKTPETLAWVSRLFNDPSKTVVFHNAKFDLEMFSFEGINIFDIKASVHCTLIISKLYNGLLPSHSLKWLTVHFMPDRSTGDKDEVVDWLKANNRTFRAEHQRPPNFSDAPRSVVKRRCIWDVESTLLLHRKLYPVVKERSPDLLDTELGLMFCVADMELRGVQVDVTRAKELRKQALKDRKWLMQEVNKIVGEITVKRKKRGVEVDEIIPAGEFNTNSGQHKVAAWQKLGIELKYKTKPKKKAKRQGKSGGGNWSFDEYAMMRYVSPHLASIMRDSGEEGWKTGRFYEELEQTIRKYQLDRSRELLPPLILKANELGKMVTTYYDHIINDSIDVYTEPNGREVGTLHCKFNQSEAMTGRFSSSEPNLQNMPRILGPRECFIPRRGRRNWHLDYSQVEMKFFAHFAEDDDMVKAVQADIHLYVATQIYGKPACEITKEQRKRAKGINFGIIYGSGPATMAETLTKKGLPTTVAEAAKLVAAYHRRFPSIRKLTNELKTLLIRQKYVENPFGRRYYIDPDSAYTALNYMCQGTSADQIKAAMVRVWRWLRRQGLRTQLIMQIHDELVLEIPPAEEHIVIPKVQKIMEDMTTFFVPITIDGDVVTRRWSKKSDPADLGLKYLTSRAA